MFLSNWKSLSAFMAGYMPSTPYGQYEPVYNTCSAILVIIYYRVRHIYALSDLKPICACICISVIHLLYIVFVCSISLHIPHAFVVFNVIKNKVNSLMTDIFVKYTFRRTNITTYDDVTLCLYIA